MKNILLILLLIPTFTFAQIVAFDLQYKDDDKGYTAKLSTSNHIIAMVDGMTCDEFFLTTDNGVLYKSNRNCTWSYVPYKQHYAMIYFNRIVDGDTVVFHKKQLQIGLMKFLPTFAPYASKKCETFYLRKDKFLKSRLYMGVYHNYYDERVILKSFRVQIRRKEEWIFGKDINKIDYEIYMKTIKKFQDLEIGDVVEFTKIKYEYPNKNGKPFLFETHNMRFIIQ
jgi:hypothetical protein